MVSFCCSLVALLGFVKLSSSLVGQTQCNEVEGVGRSQLDSALSSRQALRELTPRDQALALGGVHEV